jgi:ribosomal 30S subunit maturation factor RimM
MDVYYEGSLHLQHLRSLRIIRCWVLIQGKITKVYGIYGGNVEIIAISEFIVSFSVYNVCCIREPKKSLNHEVLFDDTVVERN